MAKLMIIDGNSLMHRAFHALPPMNNAQGTPTQAVYGFLNMLLKVLGQEKPTHLLVAFDTHAPTPRHIAYEGYKAGRKETPDELRSQFPLVKDVLKNMQIAVGEQDGYEADDYLGIFSRRAEAKGLDAILLTGDRDALQLITDKTTVILTKKGITQTVVMTEKAIEEEYGLMPRDLIEVKGLMGDASDNIPGIPGVGEKTALKLIRAYGTVEETIAHADEISGKALKERIKTYAEQARMSRQLGMICTDADVPISLSVEDCVLDTNKIRSARPLMLELGLRSIVERLPKLVAAAGGTGEMEAKDIEERSADPTLSLPSLPKTIEIRSEAELQRAVDGWKKAKTLTICWEDEISIYDGGMQWTVPFQQDLLTQGMDAEQILKSLRPVWEDESIRKECFDAKTWMHHVHDCGFSIKGNVFDAMIAAYLVETARSQPSLSVLIHEYTALEACNAFSLHILCETLNGQMQEKGMEALFQNIEMPLIRVLFSMECIGFRVDADMLKTLGEQYDGQMNKLQQAIHELAGEAFNILSPKQLAVILFEKLELPVQRKTKTGYSTDVDTLEALQEQHPIVSKILSFRQITKLKSTYIDGLLKARDENGRVHSCFNQNITATGRISSTDPNLQNIPVRTEMGREIRKAFIASPGWKLVGADYSQIELRVLAHMAQDDVMLDAFRKHEDIHARTAAEVSGCSIDAVTPDMRSAAKAVNFGIVYGISDFGLARQLGISRKEARAYIDAYLKKYTGIEQYMKRVVDEGKEKGYVTTLFGRRRDLPELKSKNYNVRAFGERAAMNAPIQGTAADIIKVAMNCVFDELEKRDTEAKLILQIHDELIIDTPPEEMETVENLLRNCMENVIKLDVPLEVDIHAGDSWYDTK